MSYFFSLTLSGPVMPCDIILLILSFICYKFFGLERINPFHPKKNATIFLGWKGLTLSSPPKLYQMKNRIKSMMPNDITGLEMVNMLKNSWSGGTDLHTFLSSALEGEVYLAFSSYDITPGDRHPVGSEQGKQWIQKPVWRFCYKSTNSSSFVLFVLRSLHSLS
jgi:hypothetical protein